MGLWIRFPCQEIFAFDSLAKGLLIFNLQGNEYKVDDLKGVMGFAVDLQGI
jgi:hypothetical protein